MSMENVIKEKTEEMVKEMKQESQRSGIEVTPLNEMYFRMGVSHGITVASIALASIPIDITIGDNK